MEAIILLNHDENTHAVEEQEKQRFLRNCLEQLGVPIQEFWTSDDPLTPQQRMKLRSILLSYGIQVIDSLDGQLQVYVENNLVAEWFKSLYKLKRDLRQRDLKKQLYLEMTVKCWSIFEDDTQSSDQER